MLKTPTRLLVTYTALALVLASCGDAQLESDDAELPQACLLYTSDAADE